MILNMFLSTDILMCYLFYKKQLMCYTRKRPLKFLDVNVTQKTHQISIRKENIYIL